MIGPAEVEDAANKLEGGESCTADCIYAEHLKYCSPSYRPMIAQSLTNFLVHG